MQNLGPKDVFLQMLGWKKYILCLRRVTDQFKWHAMTQMLTSILMWLSVNDRLFITGNAPLSSVVHFLPRNFYIRIEDQKPNILTKFGKWLHGNSLATKKVSNSWIGIVTIIGGKAWKIFEILALMYGQNFKNLPQNVRTGAGIGPKSQNLFGLSVRPPKIQNLFGWGHQASKTANFRSDWPSGLKNKPPNDNETANCTYRITIKLLSIHPVCITRLAWLPSALLACPHIRFWVAIVLGKYWVYEAIKRQGQNFISGMISM